MARLLLYHLIDYRRIFSLIDIVEPFLPIGFQITLQVVSVERAIQNIVINHKKYSEIMKKVFSLKSATPFPKCYLHKEKWTFDS
ncbi:hypothetical protein GMD93_19450 [Pseudoflavonifractor sp. BIOML-A4]|nr:hypothetical protein [Pseudoflavonifractor sp. BIOML-A4]